MTLEEAVVRNGFANVVEFNSMVASVNMTTPQNRVRLRMWQEQDGTHAGLERVIRVNGLAAVPDTLTVEKLKEAFKDGLAFAALHLKHRAEEFQKFADGELEASGKSKRYQNLVAKVHLLTQEATRIETLQTEE